MEWYVALVIALPLVILCCGAYTGMRQRTNNVDVSETLPIMIRHIRMLLPDDHKIYERIITTYIDAYHAGLIHEHPLFTYVETKIEKQYEEHLFQLLNKSLPLPKRCAMKYVLHKVTRDVATGMERGDCIYTEEHGDRRITDVDYKTGTITCGSLTIVIGPGSVSDRKLYESVIVKRFVDSKLSTDYEPQLYASMGAMKQREVERAIWCAK